MTAGAAFIQRPDGSCLYFDLSTDERHGGDADVTRFPVEEGSNIADNIRTDAAPLVLRVFISNTPLVPSGNQPGTEPGVMNSLVSSNILVDITPYKPPVSSIVAEAIINPVAAAVAGLSGQWGSSALSFPVLMFPQDFDANADAFFVLKQMQDNGELLTVDTSIASYDNVALEHFELVRNAGTGTGSEVDLTFRQITIVTTQAAAQPFNQASNPVKNKGSKALKAAPVPPTSIWAKMADGSGRNVITGAAQDSAGGQIDP